MIRLRSGPSSHGIEEELASARQRYLCAIRAATAVPRARRARRDRLRAEVAGKARARGVLQTAELRSATDRV